MRLPKPTSKAGSSFLNRKFEELIAERAADLAALRAQLEAEGLPLGAYDDILLVRYLLGFGTVKHTLTAIRAAEATKREKASVLEGAAAGRPLPCAAKIEKYQKVFVWKVSEERAIFLAQVAGIDCKELMQIATVEEVTDQVLYLARAIWLWVDKTSRTLGCIRKYDVVLDFAGYDFTSWEKIPPAAYRGAMSRGLEMSEVLHPLAQGTNTIIGLPGAATARSLLRLMKPFLPKSLAETQLCTGDRTKKSITSCPYVVRTYGSMGDNLPDFLGGKCPMGNGSVAELSAAEVRGCLLEKPAARDQAQVEAPKAMRCKEADALHGMAPREFDAVDEEIEQPRKLSEPEVEVEKPAPASTKCCSCLLGPRVAVV